MSANLKLPLVLIFVYFSSLPFLAHARGDLDGDGVVTVRDLSLLTEHLNGTAPLNAAFLDEADLDRNATVDATDRQRLVDVILLRDISPFIPAPLLGGDSLRFPSTVSAEEYFQVSFGITNTGASIIERNLTMRLWLSRDAVAGGADDVIVGTFPFTGILQPGASFSASSRIQAPVSEGNYWLVVEVDATNELRIPDAERRFANGTTPIQVVSPFTAEVATQVETAPAGSPVVMYGTALGRTGGAVPYAPVAIQIRSTTYSTTISAFADVTGRFETTWTPLPGLGGEFEISAAHRGAVSFPTQDTFRLLALEVTLSDDAVTFAEGGSATLTGTLRNPNTTALTGISLDSSAAPPGLDVALAITGGGTLAPNEEKPFTLTFSADAGISLEGTLPLGFQTAQGIDVERRVQITVSPLLARLETSAELPIYEGALRGASRSVNIPIRNTGNAATGPIQVSLPNIPWLNLASTNPMPSLAPGESGQVVLNLQPNAEVPLTRFDGNIYFQPTSGAGLSLPFEFRVVSNLRGDLEITVEDELTYFTAEKPKVAGATVRLRDAITNQELYNVITPASGVVSFPSLAEGRYYVEVSSPLHTPDTDLIELKAGKLQRETVFIQKNFVTYTWSVVPIQIEDRYRITVESVFETNVPAPVVVVSPSSIDIEDLAEVGDSKWVDMTLTNVGLIAAENNRLTLPSNPYFTFEAATTDLGKLPAQASVTVPVLIRRVAVRQVAAAQIRSAASGLTQDPDCGCGQGGLAAKPLTTDAARTNLSQTAQAETQEEETETLTFPCDKMVIEYAYWCGIRYAARYNMVPINGSDCGPDQGQDGEEGIVFPALPDGEELAKDAAKALINIRQHIEARRTWLGGGSGGGSGFGTASYSPISITLPPPDCFTLPGVLDPILKCPNPQGLKYPPFTGCAKIGASVLNDETPSPLDVGSCLCDLIAAIPHPGAQAIARLPCKARKWLSCIDALNKYFSASAAGANQAPRSIRRTATSASDRYLFSQEEIQKITVMDPALGSALARLVRDASFHLYYSGNPEAFLEAYSEKSERWLTEFMVSTDALSLGNRQITPEESATLVQIATADGLNASLLDATVQRWQLTEQLRIAGITTNQQASEEVRGKFIAADVLKELYTDAVAAVNESLELGFESPADEYFANVRRLAAEIENNTAGVCARVTMQINQSAVLTRTAFQATLSLTNNLPASPMEMVGFDLEIRDSAGAQTNDRFSVRLDLKQGFTEEGNNLTLPGQATGTLQWIIIPTDEAAPTGPQNYSFGGTIRFLQDGQVFSIPVTAANLRVDPDARLHLKYFHQRDVLADDPHTGQIEPSQPFALAVLVENRGAGPARSLSITSAQPEIVDNEKGLAVDFKILSSEVAGANATPSLEANFGDIPAGQSKVATWYLNSSLQGLFLDYAASFEHLDGRGDPRVSLIKEVSIHEMIRLFRIASGPDLGDAAFLVNDVPDAGDLPDTVHLSNGTTAPLTAVSTLAVQSNVTSGDTRTVVVRAALNPTGWSYLRAPDPAGSTHRLVQVTRADGLVIPVDSNAWQTDRTFIGLGLRPRLENHLHLIDFGGPGEYTLAYEALPVPDLAPPTSALVIDGIRSGSDVILRWSGSDNTAVARYDVYVSVNGGAFALWLAGTRDTSAVFEGEAGATYSFYTVATDAAGNREVAPTSGVALPGALTGNLAPLVVPIADQEIAEGGSMLLQVIATDPDGESSGLRYSVESAETGILIDSRSGWLQWRSSEGDGGRSIPVTVRVSDSGRPVATRSLTFSIHVAGGNAPPVLAEIPERTISHDETLRYQVTATDTDLPVQPLRFSLAAGAPAGMSIDPVSGLLEWTPGEAFAGQRVFVTILATDNGTPALSAQGGFSIQILDNRVTPTLEAVEIPPAERILGLTYAYHHGGWSELPDFAPLLPYKMGITPQPDLALRARESDYAMVFAGYLNAPVDGFYTFFGTAQNAVRLWVGDELLLDLTGADAPATGFAPLGLQAGLHPVRIEYLRSTTTGVGTLLLEWEGPDMPRTPIPSTAYITTFETLRDPAAPLDSDLDGIPDASEALYTTNPLNPDSNGNGVIDGLEDRDGDTIPNSFEIRFGTNPFDSDTNRNGILDGREDFDGDYLDTLTELTAGTDPFLADSDDDGWNDETEATAGSDALNPSSTPVTRIILDTGRVTAGSLVSPVLSPSVQAFPVSGALLFQVPIQVDSHPQVILGRPHVRVDSQNP